MEISWRKSRKQKDVFGAGSGENYKSESIGPL